MTATARPDRGSSPQVTPTPTSTRPGFTSRWQPRIKGVFTGGTLLAVVILAVVWEFCARVFDVPFLPSIVGVADRVVELIGDEEVRVDIYASLKNLALGFSIAAVLGVLIGVLMGQVRFVRAALEPYVNAMLMAPQLVFAPILFIIFGLSSGAIVTLIVMYSTFIIMVNTMAGLLTVDTALVDMARMYGGNRVQVARRVAVPAATPMIMAGIRLGMGRAVKGMINGEMFIAFVGLGSRVTTFGGRFDAEGVLAIVVIVCVVALATTTVVQWADSRLTGWCKPTRA